MKTFTVFRLSVKVFPTNFWRLDSYRLCKMRYPTKVFSYMVLGSDCETEGMKGNGWCGEEVKRRKIEGEEEGMMGRR